MFKKINLQLNNLCLLLFIIIVVFSVSLVICIGDDADADDYSYHVGRGFANQFGWYTYTRKLNFGSYQCNCL